MIGFCLSLDVICGSWKARKIRKDVDIISIYPPISQNKCKARKMEETKEIANAKIACPKLLFVSIQSINMLLFDDLYYLHNYARDTLVW